MADHDKGEKQDTRFCMIIWNTVWLFMLYDYSQRQFIKLSCSLSRKESFWRWGVTWEVEGERWRSLTLSIVKEHARWSVCTMWPIQHMAMLSLACVQSDHNNISPLPTRQPILPAISHATSSTSTWWPKLGFIPHISMVRLLETKMQQHGIFRSGFSD